MTPRAVVSPGEHGLAPRRRNEGLRGEVVDLGRLVLADDADERDLVETGRPAPG